MRIIDNILNLINKKQTTKYRVTKDCNLPSNIFTFWESGRQKPSLDALIKIANYFNVSIDYLVGRETLNQQNMSNNGTTSPLLARISNLDEMQQAKVMAYIDGLQSSDTSIAASFRRGQKMESERQSREDKMLQQKKSN